ncbi:MAG TPA: hypothetical protein VGE39_00705 [Prosthecobacter sp.]
MKLPLWWWVLSLVMVFLWLVTPDIVQTIYRKGAEVNAGAFGDTYGFITSLFSIVTTMLVVAGLIFQRREIDQLEQALRQQADEAETQNGLTRQQMAFHEIQTRIDVLPNLSAKAEFRAERIPQRYIIITNTGADIYALKVRSKGRVVHTGRACLGRGESWAAWAGTAGDAKPTDYIDAELEYVTKYAEKRREMIRAGTVEEAIGSFYESAKAIRTEVLMRAAVAPPRATEV